jgi:integrator complex subunit 11
MYHVEFEGLSAMYTGDYNSYADRHLGAACAPRLKPNILLTETTYATTIRDTKRDRERSMLHLITETVERGGKVLIPVFALGRAQELAVLLETYWKRTDSNVPIYFSAGLIEKANFFYRLFADWQNEKIQQEFAQGDNVFEFKKVKPFDKSLIRADTPYVLFATPGMLHSGTSVQVFKEWCGDERNTLIIPGYCVEGTLGNRLLKGAKEVTIDKKVYEVKMSIQNVSFSAHADAKGIINLLRNVDPDEIVFVHGDKHKMTVFKPLVEQQLKRNVHMPANLIPLDIRASPAKEITLLESSIALEGFIASKSNTMEHILLSEQEMLEEVR